MRDRRGFSLAEMVIVIVMMSVLTSMVSQRMGPAKNEYSVRSARTIFASMLHRTRAHAVERGERVRIEIDLSGDSVWIASDTATIDTFRFKEALDVDLIGIGTSQRMCINPRGFADQRCTSFSSRYTLKFVLGMKSSGLEILPLGQVVYQ